MLTMRRVFLLLITLLSFYSLSTANVNRARPQKIRRVRGKVWWEKRRRKIVRRDNGKVVEFERAGMAC